VGAGESSWGVQVRPAHSRLALAFGRSNLAATPPIGCAGGLRCRAVHALQPPDLDLFGAGLRCHVVIEDAGFGFLDVLIDHDPDDDVLSPAEGSADREAIALPNHSMGLGVLAVHVDLPAFAGALGL